MLNLFLFLLRNLMKMKMKDFHMILMPQVQMIIQIPLPTTTPTSFVPGDHAQPAQQQSSQGTPALISSQDGDETEPYETDDTPVLTEEEIVSASGRCGHWTLHIRPFSFCRHWWYCFFPLGPKSQAAPDLGSYDVTGFNQFEQYLARNGKKQPKAESVITQEVLRKYAKEIKQAKLEEFRSFLDFTAMTFRDKRRHKIDNYVTGRWVVTIKVDKDGQFKKFKARWVCRGFQDAQKYDLQTDSPTLLPGMDFLWHLSMQPPCIGIYSI